MNQEEKRILEVIDRNKNEIISTLRKLVQIPSLTGEEGEIQKYQERIFRKMGLEVDVWEPNIKELFDCYPEVAQYPSCWQPELDLPLRFPDQCNYKQLVESEYIKKLNYDGRPNVVGVLKGNGGGKSLILNGHIDVVTVGDRSRWKHNPFGAEIEGDLLYGRGAVDMKGGVVAMIKAVESIMKAGIKLRGDIIIQSVVNEEHSGNGTLACLVRGYTADAAIVTEPTNLRNIAVSSGGGVYWEIKIKGREVHTGSRWKGREMYGISAIEKAAVVIDELLKMEKMVNSKDKIMSLGIGQIEGGDYATSTAKECLINGVVYFSPKMGTGIEGIRMVKGLLRQSIDRASNRDVWLQENVPELSFLHYDDAYKYDDVYKNPVKDGIYEILAGAGEEVTGEELNMIGLSACDSRHLGNQGGIPTILYGPGDMAKAHSVDENINIRDVIEATKILALTIYRWSNIY